MYEMPVNMEDFRKCGSVVPRLCKIQASELSCCFTARHCSPFVGSCHGNLNLTEVTTQVEGTEAQGGPKLSEICQRRRLSTTWGSHSAFSSTRKMLSGRCIGGPGMPGHARCGWPWTRREDTESRVTCFGLQGALGDGEKFSRFYSRRH